MQNVSKSLLFVKHLVGVSSKSNKPYNMIFLSDGLESKIFTSTLTPQLTEDLTVGEEYSFEFSVDVFKSRVTCTGVN